MEMETEACLHEMDQDQKIGKKYMEMYLDSNKLENRNWM